MDIINFIDNHLNEIFVIICAAIILVIANDS